MFVLVSWSDYEQGMADFLAKMTKVVVCRCNWRYQVEPSGGRTERSQKINLPKVARKSTFKNSDRFSTVLTTN